MNRRLVKPFFNKYLKLKLTKIAQQNAAKIQMPTKDKFTKLRETPSKNSVLKKNISASNNKDLEAFPPTKTISDKKSRYYSTQYIQGDRKEFELLGSKRGVGNNYSDLHYKLGDEATFEKIITAEDIRKFIELSGDSNPIHYSTEKQKAVVHGAFLNSLVSNVIGTKLPGAGTVVTKQTLNFPNKCYEGEVVKVNVKITQARKIIKVDFKCTVDESGGSEKVVLFGDAQLIRNNLDKIRE